MYHKLCYAGHIELVLRVIACPERVLRRARDGVHEDLDLLEVEQCIWQPLARISAVIRRDAAKCTAAGRLRSVCPVDKRAGHALGRRIGPDRARHIESIAGRKGWIVLGIEGISMLLRRLKPLALVKCNDEDARLRRLDDRCLSKRLWSRW